MIFNVFEDRNGNLWLGHGDGLIQLKGGQTDKSQMTSYLNGVPVSSVNEDRDGFLWLGTYGRGLVRFDPETTEAFFFTDRNGIDSDSIFQLLEDEDGRFWIAGQNGITFVERSELNTIADRKSGSASCIIFGTDDGLLNSQCSIEHKNSAARTKDGLFLFATKNGISAALPSHLELNTVPPLVRLENMAIDGKPVDPSMSSDEPVELSTRRRLSIDVRAFSSLGTDRIRYRYRLLESDKDWTTLKPGADGQVSFSDLPPGRHQFQMTASNNHGAWNEEGIAVSFLVRPMFYQTLLFFLLSALFMASVGGFFVLRSHRIRMKRKNKYSRTKLPVEKTDYYKARVLELLEHDKIYRDASLSVQRLSGRLSIPSHHLSQVINSGLNKTFYDLVNSYRIEEAKVRLEADKEGEEKILAIAFDVGFGSLGSFNRAFKRHTGKTPSEFRDVQNGLSTH